MQQGSFGLPQPAELRLNWAREGVGGVSVRRARKKESILGGAGGGEGGGSTE